MTRRVNIAVGAGLAGMGLALMLAAAPATAQTLKMGIIGPLSGAAAVYGSETLEGARFALDALAKAGTLGGLKIELIPDDSTANPGKAAQGAARMVASDDVLAIIGG